MTIIIIILLIPQRCIPVISAPQSSNTDPSATEAELAQQTQDFNPRFQAFPELSEQRAQLFLLKETPLKPIESETRHES